jgi:hypothetical protein
LCISRALYRRIGKEWMLFSGHLATKLYFTTLPRPPQILTGPQPGSETSVERGVHLGPSHAYIPKSDSPGIIPATFSVLGVRFTDASEKNGCRLVAILPLSSISRHVFVRLSSKARLDMNAIERYPCIYISIIVYML